MVDEDEEANFPFSSHVAFETAGEAEVSSTEASSETPNSSPPVERPNMMTERRLTETSKKYDRDGKGYLNEAELAMRRMDSKNNGFLDNDKVSTPFGVCCVSVCVPIYCCPHSTLL